MIKGLHFQLENPEISDTSETCSKTSYSTISTSHVVKTVFDIEHQCNLPLSKIRFIFTKQL